MAGFPGAYLHQGVLRDGSHRRPEEVRRADALMHGDDDQIVPIGASALLSSKMIKNAQLKVYPGAPHGMCSTHKDQVNEDLLAFFKT